MPNSSVLRIACLSLTWFSNDKLHISIQFSDCSLILDTEKFDVVWGKLLPNMYKTWSFFDEKLCNSVTKNVTALRSFFAFFSLTVKTQGKLFLRSESPFNSLQNCQKIILFQTLFRWKISIALEVLEKKGPFM